MPKFSILIPVYNSRPYLRECLDSVLEQTLPNWEAICIDDGSTDGSGSILDEYASRDSRFIVRHQSNGGVSAARNTALEMVRGEWFFFLDGDDIIAPWTCEVLMNQVAKFDCDAIISYPACVEVDAGAGGVVFTREVPLVSTCEVLSEIDFLYSKYFRGCICGAALKSSKFKTVQLPLSIPMMEDFCYRLRCLMLRSRWGVVDTPFYAYRRTGSSATIHDSPRKNAGGIHALVLIAKDLQKIMPDQGRVKRFLVQRKGTYLSLVTGVFRWWLSYDRQERVRLLGEISFVDSAMGGDLISGFTLARMLLARNRFFWRLGSPIVALFEFLKLGISSRMPRI